MIKPLFAIAVFNVVICSVPAIAISEEAGTPLTFFLVTIDTETSAGCGAHGCYPESIEEKILGRRGTSYYGIPLIMNILEKYGMRGTFFVNAYLDSYYPEKQIKEIVQEIIRRGHDVQFHAHEEFRCFGVCKQQDTVCWNKCTKEISYISGNTLENQVTILREGADNIRKWSGKYPLAFRGGAFDADISTLKALKKLGILVDSSLSGPDHALARVFPINTVSEHNGVVELPLFTYREKLLLIKRISFLDIESTTLVEHKYLLNEAITGDIRAVVLMMHSFSFCRREQGCPIIQHVKRFDKLLEYVRRNPNLKVSTMSEVWQEHQTNKEQFSVVGLIPETTYFLTLHRSLVRFGYGWKNKVFLFGNLVLVVGAGALITFGTMKLRNRRRSKSMF